MLCILKTKHVTAHVHVAYIFYLLQKRNIDNYRVRLKKKKKYLTRNDEIIVAENLNPIQIHPTQTPIIL